jgi:hypothetical protein
MPLAVRWALAGALALWGAGCMVAGDSPLSPRDNAPPTIRETLPPDLGQIPRNQPIKIIFSEPMDPRSIRPGINLYLGKEQVPLQLEIPPPGLDPDPVAIAQPWEVTGRPTGGLLASDSTYTLFLRTVLTDTAGNPLDREEKITFFTSP